MKIKWINTFPTEIQEIHNFLKNFYTIPLEEAFKLIYLTLKLKTLSDSPIYKFLERTVTGIKLDEIEKREYLITFSIYTLRNLIKEHLDLKLVKNLYLFLVKKLPKEFFKGVLPKHSIIASQDIIINLLSKKEKMELPSFLKTKHLILAFKFEGNCEELIYILSYLPNPYLIKKNEIYEVFTTFSISEFIIFYLESKEKNFLKEEIEIIFETIKNFFPDCFGEI